MTFLPIVDRELRVASRRRGTYWLRSGVALAVTAACAWIYLASLDATPPELGQRLFYVLTGGTLFICLFAGARSTADCLSEEKREGTLGLLFLTDLKGYDVVCGKLAANSMSACYGLLAIVPVLGLPLLLGGVTPGEFGRMAAVLLDALFLSLSIGLFASAISRSCNNAVATTFLLVLIFAAGFPALGAWAGYKMNLDEPVFAFFLPSAGYAYAMALDQMYRAAPAQFYWSLGTVHALGWVFFGLAVLITPRSWQDRPAGVRATPLREFWHAWKYGAADGQRAFRRRLLDQNAFYWLAARVRMKPLWIWGVLAMIAGGWVWGALKFQRDWLNAGIYITTALVLNTLLKGGVAAEAARQLGEDRVGGTLELLLSTSLTVPDILRGQRLALQRQFLGPLGLALLAEFVMLIAGLGEMRSGSDLSAWVCLCVALMVMLVADLITLYWVGMWMSLSAKNPKRVSSSTVARVLVLPWIGYAVFLTFAGLVSVLFREEVFGWQAYLGVWFGLGLVTDVGYGLWARHNLLTKFRQLAEQRYERRAPLWKRLFGKHAETVVAARPRAVAP